MTSHFEVPPPDQETIESACLTYRHDFGLLDGGLQSCVRAEARRWLSAWRTGFASGGQVPGPRGLGHDDGEPHARTIDAACVSFDPAFRMRAFHEASAIRRSGIEWLRAWRAAFDDEPMAPEAVAQAFDDLGAAIRAASAAGVLPESPSAVAGIIAASPLDRLPASVAAALDAEPTRPDAIQPARPSALSDVAVEAVAVLENVVLAHLRAVLQSNPDQPFVDFKPIAAALGIDHDTTRAILWRLKKRGAVDWQPLFPNGDYGILLQGGGYAIAQGASDGT